HLSYRKRDRIAQQFHSSHGATLHRNPSPRPSYGECTHFHRRNVEIVHLIAFACASLIACHTFIGVSGECSVLISRSLSASITPLTMQGGPPIAPDSPQPLAPSGLVRHGADSSS